jgi:CBS domain-containing protein
MTTPDQAMLACPACGEDNIRGTDRCSNCMLPLRSLDTPETHHAFSDSELAEELSQLRIHRALTLAPSATLKEAVSALREDPSGAVLLKDPSTDRIVGIFTERDVMTRLAGYGTDLSEPVSKHMTHDPVILRDSDTIAVALNKMGDGGFRHIPLFHDGELAGVVTANDLVRWVMTRYFA